MRERGFTLFELMIVVAIAAVSGGAMAALGLSMHRTEQETGAYVRDLDGLRRAVRTIERDLRAASQVDGGAVGGAAYRLEGGTLLREGRVLARNVASFALARDGRLVTATLELAARSRGRGPSVSVRVCLREGEER